MFTYFIQILILTTTVQGAVLEAHITIQSESLHTAHFLDRIKSFVKRTHCISSKATTGNDTFRANYDFTANLLTVATSYSLIQEGVKLSDINVRLHFQFQQDSEQNILLEDLHGHALPHVKYKPKSVGASTQTNFQRFQDELHEEQSENDSSLIGHLLHAIKYTIEPIVVTIIHIIVQGVLSNVVTDAVDRFYLGHLAM